MKTYVYSAGRFSQVLTKELLKQGVKIEGVIDKYSDKKIYTACPL